MTKVTIDNFQSIKHVEFEINGLTVIVGKNNIGKSAIFRAIDAALSNQAGNNFIRKGEKVVEVKIKRDDIDIEWKKGVKAVYKVNNETFSALNRDIPEPMLKAGFGKINIGDKAISPIMAEQFDELFLIDKPGSVVTEVLASLYDLDILSKADDLCQKNLKGQKTLSKIREADLTVIQDKLKKFKDFEKVKALVDSIIEKDNIRAKIEAEIQELKDYEEEIQSHIKNIKMLEQVKKIVVPDIIISEKLSRECLTLKEWSDAIYASAKTLESLKKSLKAVIPDYSKVSAIIDEIKELSQLEHEFIRTVNLVKAIEPINNIDLREITQKSEIIENKLGDFRAILAMENLFISAAESTKYARDELKKIVLELEQKNKEKAEFKICPLCERPF